MVIWIELEEKKKDLSLTKVGHTFINLNPGRVRLNLNGNMFLKEGTMKTN